MMEAARTSETSVDNHFTRQYNPEDSSEHQFRPVYRIYYKMENIFKSLDFNQTGRKLQRRVRSDNNC
jgi:hypothetical protein